MECEWVELETHFNASALGRAFTRIVRIIVTMMQADICGGGLASAAAYGLLQSKTISTTDDFEIMKLGGDDFARVVLKALCEAKAGTWSRPPGVTYYAPSETTPPSKNTLSFTPMFSTCFNDERIGSLARAAQAIIKKTLVDLDCVANKDAHVAILTRTLVNGLDGTSSALTCTRHVTDRFRDLTKIVSGHDALAVIREEIATALCGTQGNVQLTKEQFAARVARLFVDAACALKASIG